MKNQQLARRISQAMGLPAVRGVVTNRLINLVGSLGCNGEKAFGLAFSIAEELEQMEDPHVSADRVWRLITGEDTKMDTRISEMVTNLLANRAQIIAHQIQTHLPSFALPRGEGKAILDFGAGDGEVTRTVADRLGVSITGIDLNGHAGKGITGYEGPTLPFPNGNFDLTLAVCALHHTANLQYYLAELHRVTKVGGHLVAIETLTGNLDVQFGADIGTILDYVACWCISRRHISISGNYHGYHEWPGILLDAGFEPIDTLSHTGYQNPDDLGVDQPLIQIPHGIFIAERRPDPVAN